YSLFMVFEQCLRIYQDPATVLPAIDVSFRDYVLAEVALQDSAEYGRSRDYWIKRIQTLPPAPALPLISDPATLKRPQFVRRTAELDPESWSRLKERAARLGLTRSIVLCTAFAEVLAVWSKNQRFSLNLTLFNRLPLHPQVNEIVGDFTSLTLLDMDCSTIESFEARARRVQEQL